MKKPKLTTYGHDQTIHGTHLVDVETDKDGKVVSVWFRCMALKFEQCTVGPDRARAMTEMYKENKFPNIHAVVVEDRREI